MIKYLSINIIGHINIIMRVGELLRNYHLHTIRVGEEKEGTYRNRNLYSGWAEGYSQWQPCWTDRSDSCRFQPSRSTHVHLVPSTRLRSWAILDAPLPHHIPSRSPPSAGWHCTEKSITHEWSVKSMRMLQKFFVRKLFLELFLKFYLPFMIFRINNYVDA